MCDEQNNSTVQPGAAQNSGIAVTDGPEAQLENYEAIKFELAGLIREGDSAAWYAKNEPLQRDFQSLLQHLAEDRFYLTLAGQFSRGKSTLMNAMLGMDRLPTGILPMTSVITAVSYYTHERVRMHFENSNLTHEVSLSELPEWITEQGNPGNQRKIDMAEVQLPAELLRRGAFFVDTPGLGSAVIENTKTTHRFLPQVDALVLVTSFDFPLSQEELLFLRQIRELHRKIFIVINKKDLCADAQRDQVLQFIRSRMAQEFGSDEIRLFPVSASQALAAKLENDSEGLQRSGLPAFEKALVEYLLTDRSRDLLVATCDRIESLLAVSNVAGLEEIETRLARMRAEFRGEGPDNSKASRAHEPVPLHTRAAESVRISSCFVCKRMADATFKFMSQFQYNLSHRRDEQLSHASRSGFCSLHTREYAKLASPQGIAAGYPHTLVLVAEHLQSLVHDGRLRDDWKDNFDQLLPGVSKCQACRVVADVEAEVMDNFVRDSQEVQAPRADLPCVCLRHLEAIAQRATGTELAVRMVLRSVRVLRRTAENMERFALRHGGHHLELVTDEELRSPENGLNLLVGQPNIRPMGSY
ncbi:MAG TPA: dynamin family protein [Candidatus Limnocylindrales bacterium]|nr:dynamin family protein [Candidatus Limnocylindrales bacterium]